MGKKFYTTGIGSLPFIQVEEALTIISQFCPEVPYWPQLPQRSNRELMLEAFLYPWIKRGLVSFENGRGIFSDAKPDKYLAVLEQERLLPREIFPGLYGLIEKKGEGLFPKAKAFKGQITGPNTLCKYSFSPKGLSLNHHSEMVEIILNLVELQLEEQLKLLKGLQVPVMIIIDEPAGFLKPNEPNYQAVQKGLRNIIEKKRSDDCYMGIHVCSKPDWQELVKLPVDIISFDAFSYGEDIINSKDAKTYLSSGGKIFWGIVPTEEPNWNKVKKTLENIKKVIQKHGGMITPSCGLGFKTSQQGLEILKLTTQVANYLQV